MAKNKTVFVCNECGYESPKWMGKCPACNAWNSFYEEKVISTFRQELRECLSEYKMYLNESKTQYQSRPFISNISICKMALKTFINDFYVDKMSDARVKHVSHVASYANKNIARIKGIIKTYPEVTYKSISGFLLSEFSRKLSSFLKQSVGIVFNCVASLKSTVTISIQFLNAPSSIVSTFGRFASLAVSIVQPPGPSSVPLEARHSTIVRVSFVGSFTEFLA